MTRVAKWFRTLAFAAFGTSAVSFGAVCLLPVFEPCRIFYRTHNWIVPGFPEAPFFERMESWHDQAGFPRRCGTVHWPSR